MADSNAVLAHTITEPRDDMEFESHEAAYSFYKEYARSVGFGTAKLSSCRSRVSKEFIDAKSDRMRKRKNLSSGSKILNAHQTFDCLETYLRNPHDKGRSLALEEGDAQMLLELFMHIQEDNPKFFYAVDLNEEHRLRNVFWVDAKGME